MKKRWILFLFLLAFRNWTYAQSPQNADSMSGIIQKLANEKHALENTIIEMNEAGNSRDLGYNFGMAGAILGFVFMSFGFSYQQRKTRIANEKLTAAYAELKNTQEQLIKSEKMAAFGVVSTRLSHEILNPLNFVNNFSELSQEMFQEIDDAENIDDRKEIMNQLRQTLGKINEHGKRATSIVKQLQELSTAGMAHEFFDDKIN